MHSTSETNSTPKNSQSPLPPAMGVPVQYDHPPTATGVPVPWSTGLFDCFDDIHSCCLTCWCPCVTFGRIGEIVDKGSTSCGVHAALFVLILLATGCPCIYTCFYRSKLREQYFLEGSPCPDFLIHCCCEECALCQEYRHLKNQGFDMSIGWQENLERRKHLEMSPVVQERMNR